MPSNKNVAVLAFPFGTHAAPLFNLVLRISASVPDATFFFFSTAQSNRTTFKNAKVDKVKPVDVSDGLPEGYAFKGNPVEPMEYFLKATPENYKRAVDAAAEATGRKFDCFLTDAFLWFAADFAEEMHVPWMALWTAGPRALYLHAETDNIRRQLGNCEDPDQNLDFLPESSGIQAAHLPEGVGPACPDEPFPNMLQKMGQTLSQATVVAGNSYEDLDSTYVKLLKSEVKTFLNIGPFNLLSASPLDDPHGCLDWLSKQPQASVVYISFGSVITPPRHELIALAEALEECHLPYLWSFRGNPQQLLPKGFLERTAAKGKVVSWAPQQKILEHPSVGVFLTHCGWNSILESIAGGVPLLCRPFFGDQKLNMKTIEAVWGTGVGLEGDTLTKTGVVKALKLILFSEEGTKMRQKIGVHRDHAIKAVDKNGSSTQNFKLLVETITKC